MASVIDLTDDLRAELAMAQNLGAGFGSAAGYIVADHRRRKLEQMIVSTIQDAETRGLNAAAIRRELIKNAQIVRDKHGQEVIQIYGQQAQIEQNEKLREAQVKYWNSKGAAGVTAAQESNIIRDLMAAREAAYMQGDEDLVRKIDDKLRQYLPQVSGTDFDRIDRSKLPKATEQLTLSIPAGTPEINQSPQPDIAAQAMEGQAFTGEPPAGQMAKWQSMTPEQRVAYFTGKETKADTALAAELNKQSFAPYMDKLDPDDRGKLERILAEGNPQKIQIALERLRQTYGTL